MHYVAGAVIKILRERALCHAALCCELEVTQDPGKNLNWSRILRAYDYYGGHYLRYRSRWRGNSSKGSVLEVMALSGTVKGLISLL